MSEAKVMPQVNENRVPTSEPHAQSAVSSHIENGEEIVDHATTSNAVATSSGTTSGWRLGVITFCLCFGLLLSTLETTIVATALVSISSHFGDFHLANWVVVAYLLTYTGFLVVYARASDIFGRKEALLVALALFGLFSLACGLAQSMKQLIILRAFQGIGGSGIYSMVFVIVPEVTPVTRFGLISGLVSGMFAMSSVLGPILGGVIVNGSSWRWVFLLNVPCAAVIIAILFLFYPKSTQRLRARTRVSQVDLPGVVFSLAGSVLLVFALEQGGTYYPWRSPTTIASLAVAGSCWFLFIGWEFALPKISRVNTVPIFPLRLVKHRVLAACLGSAFLAGFPFMVIIINLPQRFQLVNGESPVAAGTRMLPLLLCSALGSGVGGIIAGKKNVSFYLLACGSALQVIGVGLMSSLPTTIHIPPKQYGFQAILGFGFGMGLGSLIIVSRVEVNADDSAIVMGSITQVRVLGGCIGLAIATANLNHQSSSALASVLSPAQIAAILQSANDISILPAQQIVAVRRIFGEAFNRQMQLVMYIALVSFVASLFAFRKKQLSLAEIKERQMQHLSRKQLEGKDHAP